MNQKQTFSQKLAFIIKSFNSKSTNPYEKLINQIQKTSNNKQILKQQQQPSPKRIQEYILAIKIETLYKLCMPAIYSINWDANINHQIKQVYLGIVAFQNQSQEHYVCQYVNKWVQSGGAKTVALKIGASSDKIIKFIKNTHGLVIPEHISKANKQHIHQFFDKLTSILKQEPSFETYPILAQGNSAILFMSYFYFKDQEFRSKLMSFLSKQQIFNSDSLCNASVISSHNHLPFSDIQLKTRIQIQNKLKIVHCTSLIPFDEFYELEINNFVQIKAIAEMKNRNCFVSTCISHQKEELKWFIWTEPQKFVNPDSITTNFKIISNFTDQIRKTPKKVDDKLEIEHHKLIFNEQRSYFNIDIKNKPLT